MVASKLEISFLIVVVVVPLLVIRSVTFPYRSCLRSLKDLNFFARFCGRYNTRARFARRTFCFIIITLFFCQFSFLVR